MGIFNLFNNHISKSIHNAVATLMNIDEPYDLTQDEIAKIQTLISTVETGVKAKELKALYHGSTDYAAKMIGFKSITITEEEQKILDKLLTTENGIKFIELLINTAEPYVWKFAFVAALQHLRLEPEKINMISQAIDANEYAQSAVKILGPTLSLINRPDLTKCLQRPNPLQLK